MERIVFLDRGGISVPLRPPCFPHHWQEYPDTRPEDVVGRLADATIAITDQVAISAEHLAELPQLRLIAVAATGVDHVDLDACRHQGVTVVNVRNWSVSVPEHVFSLILALRRNLLAYHEAIREGAWQRSEGYLVQVEPMPRSLSGATLGIIGVGALGSAVAALGKAFGMEVLFAERKGAAELRPDRTPFEEVLAKCDVLVLLCPLTEESRGMIGAAELELMPRHAILVNCGRGGLLDEAALAQALEEGAIAGAGLDVLTQEPPRDGSPLLDLKRPNLIVTPHVAWISDRSLATLAEQVIGNVEGFVLGHPRNLVV
ncbi:D-2-hydroxyacid dehydrogenase [Geomonas sp. Red69]|uniref:D-2-hydroxyacid dehydrogenase n=1 Tax=Geomonas diazotrophica TaxID=2843197 RepID=A0ABX8JK91_9BACT|nr:MULTISPECIES: D-2-hydroxyacid dehydrogenase [Geomonas]MBU5635208.1 D-2-hydroxyacid dehydrogenase [Geomonas diazotrophica]QWV97732.1 D-2-hydroxyacid dehydrogenase [Geomonas nitrogeniifigens]QXE86869.1 D-2-hydroxyacid dehydrogenase [Geomonas nitrogeniifigens]